jgi:hypothetical protein
MSAPTEILDAARAFLAGPQDAAGNRALARRGFELARALRRGVCQELARRAARFVIVSEYGRRLPPGLLPYPRMITALVEASALACMPAAAGTARVHPVIAFRPGSFPIADCEAWNRALAEMAAASNRRRTGPPIGDVEVQQPERPPAEERAGLQVADVIVHALGPGALQEVEPPAEQVARWDRRRVDAEAQVLLGLPSGRLSERDALEPWRLMRRSVSELDHDRGFDECVARLDEAFHAPTPPAGVYRVAVEEARASVALLEELR